MNKVRRLFLKAAQALDLPADILAGVPRVELIGGQECSVEPHQGLREYTKEKISVATTIGIVAIIGSNLEVKRMNAQRITVSGHVFQVTTLSDVNE